MTARTALRLIVLVLTACVDLSCVLARSAWSDEERFAGGRWPRTPPPSFAEHPAFHDRARRIVSAAENKAACR